MARAGVRAVRAGCCVASAGVPLFGLGVVCGQCRSPFVCCKRMGGFGWLMLEEVSGAFMAQIFSL